MTSKIITGYYGKDGAMTSGWETEEEAQAEFDEYYADDENFEGCFVHQESDGEWVIAY